MKAWGRRYLQRYTLRPIEPKRPEGRKPIDIRAALNGGSVGSATSQSTGAKTSSVTSGTTGSSVEAQKEHTKTLESAEAFTMPFINFDNYDVLVTALSNELQPSKTPYAKYISIKDDLERHWNKPSKDLMDLLAEYGNRTSSHAHIIELSLPVGTVNVSKEKIDALLEVLDSASDDFEGLESTIAKVLDENRRKLSWANAIDAMLAAPNSNTSKLAKLVCMRMADFLPEELDRLLHRICQQDDKNEVAKSLQLIATAFQRIMGESLLRSATPDLKLQMLVAYIGGKEYQSAMNVFNSLLKDDNACPPPQIVTDYIRMISDMANALEEPFDKKQLVFNMFAKPAAVSLRTPGVLSMDSFEAVLPWIPRMELSLFVKYLRKCPGYSHVIKEGMAAALLKHHAKTWGKSSSCTEAEKAINLTSFIDLLETPAVPLTQMGDDAVLAAAEAYARYNAPVAVEVLLDGREGQSDPERLAGIVSILKKVRQQPFDDLPGRSKEDRENAISKLYISK